jgi:Zn-dependent peptidase ImmA (M78 family)
MGAQLRYSPLDDELAGMVFIKDGVPIIGVNSLHHPNRQRFTIAHEIAHLHLHRAEVERAVHVDKGWPDFALKRDAMSATGSNTLEIEANKFAAALLMPKDAVIEALNGEPWEPENEAAIEQLAKRFRVSFLTVQHRLTTIFGPDRK